MAKWGDYGLDTNRDTSVSMDGGCCKPHRTKCHAFPNADQCRPGCLYSTKVGQAKYWNEQKTSLHGFTTVSKKLFAEKSAFVTAGQKKLCAYL